ncbi:MAG: hypothetical protein JSU00_14430 [Acidobacteria bacterium]|nr:hypothetical protein [Acidobacteriota bacterium]
MAQLGEAIARYHKILESDPYKDLEWANALQEQMKARHLITGTRPVTPVLRPHLITKRQYANLVKAAESLFGAIRRIEKMALGTPQLLSRMQLLPAEKMLAGVDPGYSFASVTSLLDTNLHNGSMRFVDYNAETPLGVAFGEALDNLFYDAPPVKEFRKKYPLTKVGGTRYLLTALLKAYKEFGKTEQPNIAIVEFRQPFQTAESPEFLVLADYFRSEGYNTEVVSPDQLEYRNGVLRKGDFRIDLVYRRVKVHEFLVRFDLSHPLMRAYRDHAVCVVNSFRSELGQKKAMFDLLTDETITASFPAAERKVIREFIPWTRVVAATNATYQDQTVDLPDFILKNRTKLVLRPNDDSADNHAFRGSETDEASWEKALKQAMRTPYVVQEETEPTRFPFPVYQYGSMSIRDLRVDVHPHSFLGKVQGCSSYIRAETPSGFTTIAGLAPTFILDAK